MLFSLVHIHTNRQRAGWIIGMGFGFGKPATTAPERAIQSADEEDTSTMSRAQHAVLVIRTRKTAKSQRKHRQVGLLRPYDYPGPALRARTSDKLLMTPSRVLKTGVSSHGSRSWWIEEWGVMKSPCLLHQMDGLSHQHYTNYR